MLGTFRPEELERLIEESGVAYKSQSRSFILDCPECGKKGKLWILKKNGAFVCWSCSETNGFKGFADVALARILNQSPFEVRSRLYEGGPPPGSELKLTMADFDEDDLIDLPFQHEEIEWPWDSVEIDAPAACKGADYLRSRELPLVVASYFKVRYWPAERRVLFPVIVNERLLGYQGRAIFETAGTQIPKAKTSEGLRKSLVLMFQDSLKDSDHAVVCEGPMDALKAVMFKGAVATMGKGVSKEQLQVIRSYGIKKVYLALDPDAAAETSQLAKELGDLDTYLVLPPNGKKDLGECRLSEAYEACKNAQPFTAGNLLVSLRAPT